jgi:ectoine hydroxylase-related dioxygenase (phytanoyl-CoA dioxygenase family)
MSVGETVQARSSATTAFFEEHGWLKNGEVVSPDLIRETYEAVLDLYFGRVKTDLVRVSSLSLRKPVRSMSELTSRYDDYVYQQVPAIQKLVRESHIAALAAHLLDSQSLRLWYTSLTCKSPGSVDGERQHQIQWHCDGAFWKNTSSPKLITVWIPLQDCGSDMGSLTYIDRSHKWEVDPQVEKIRDVAHFWADDGREVEKDLREIGVAPVKVLQEMSVGDVTFHHGRTFHFSGRNTSDRHRICLAVHFQDVANEYVCVDPEQFSRNEALCRRTPEGVPDYSDPFVCPLVYTAGSQAVSGVTM